MLASFLDLNQNCAEILRKITDYQNSASNFIYRGGGAGCAGCAFAHPIFGPPVRKMQNLRTQFCKASTATEYHSYFLKELRLEIMHEIKFLASSLFEAKQREQVFKNDRFFLKAAQQYCSLLSNVPWQPILLGPCRAPDSIS